MNQRPESTTNQQLSSPLRTIPTRPSRPWARIPSPVTSLVGRDADIETILSLLRDPEVRHITLSGPGGVGKTRLAIEAAKASPGHFADGVAFVSLAVIHAENHFSRTVAAALGLIERPGEDPAEAVEHLLAQKRFLLVLDNFEHLIGAASQVTRWLQACQSLTVLVTSRASLRSTGEHLITLAPLATTSAGHPLDRPGASPAPAVRLFVDRAASVAPGFRLTDTNHDAVTAICTRLDGLPLAIELAAARMQHLSPQALLDRLDRRLPLLTGGPADQPPRLQTLQNAIGWSYDLLTPVEQDHLRKIGVFVGGFTLEAAEALCNNGSELLDIIGALVSKSLIWRDQTSEQDCRYQMLETVREFALDRLEESGELVSLRTAHAMYFVQLAEQADEAIWGGPNHVYWLDRLEAELPNLRAGLSWLETTGDDTGLIRLAAALGGLWRFRSHRIEGREWLTKALALGGHAAPAARATALVKVTTIDWDLSGSPRTDYLLEAIQIRRTLGDDRGVGRAFLNLSTIAASCGDVDASARLAAEARTHSERAGDLTGLARVQLDAGRSAVTRGNPCEARERLQESLALYRQDGFQFGMSNVLVTLGNLEFDLGNNAAATDHFRECLELWPTTQSKECLVDCLVGTACLAWRYRRAKDAAMLLGAAKSLSAQLGYVMPPAQTERVNQAIGECPSLQSMEDFATSLSDGASWPLDQMRAVASQLLAEMSLASAGARKRPNGLTSRELDVVQLLAKGKSNREIAQTLFVSQNTVISHVRHVMAKIELDSRAAVAAWAVRNGLD
ncbi:MAG: hypothetical protein KF883_00765 [Thermomicrobiales bacterium]|nr:hypothetical protein [Thermomicrobiales bacterium]